MNVIHSGGTFRIYGDDLMTYDKLPVGVYEVGFSKFSGFFLTKHNDLIVNEEKVYGNTEKKVKKVLYSFKKVDRNFGVILSGRKGIGKSLFARLLSVHAKEDGLPLILVTAYYPGIADFLSSIEQEVVVLFDEFEKTFANKDGVSPQEELLPMFDGLDGGKKLFVVTCNDVRKLNTYLINRPGRFHYHFTLTNPTPDEVREYMEDKLEEQHHHLIKKIVGFAAFTDVTYDILRAIAFEVNNGFTLEETLADLNISKEDLPKFDIVVSFADGTQRRAETDDLDLRSDKSEFYWLSEPQGSTRYLRVEFRPCDIVFDFDHAEMTLDPNLAERYVDEDDFELDDPVQKEKYEYIRNLPITKVQFIKKTMSSMLKFTV